jgi:hypothetical protein
MCLKAVDVLHISTIRISTGGLNSPSFQSQKTHCRLYLPLLFTCLTAFLLHSGHLVRTESSLNIRTSFCSYLAQSSRRKCALTHFSAFAHLSQILVESPSWVRRSYRSSIRRRRDLVDCQFGLLTYFIDYLIPVARTDYMLRYVGSA